MPPSADGRPSWIEWDLCEDGFRSCGSWPQSHGVAQVSTLVQCAALLCQDCVWSGSRHRDQRHRQLRLRIISTARLARADWS
jgi:hypothetical protein